MRSYLGMMLMVLTILFGTACETQEDRIEALKAQDVLFHLHQFGLVDCFFGCGWFIDADGNVLAYENTEDWNSQYVLSTDEMESNLSHATNRVMQIDRIELNDKLELIQGAHLGMLTEEENGIADGGEWSWRAYIYNERKGEYEAVILGHYGDVIINNDSKEAQTLQDWMTTIEGSL